MERVCLVKIVLLCVAMAAPAEAAMSNQGQVSPGRYIVQIAPSTDARQLAQNTAQLTGGALGHVYTTALNGFSIQLPSGLTARDLLARPGVLRVETDLRVYTAAQTLPTGIDRIDMDRHGAVPIDGVNDRLDVDIAIIDTGIDVDHPDLTVVGGRRFYTTMGRSYQDDRYDDDNGHGTHCAGIAAAIDNNIGVVGVAPGGRLWAVKVLDSQGSGYVSDLIAGIDWVTARAGTIEVANMSLAATGRSDILRTAIRNSVAAGVVHVAAAGNSNRDIYGRDGVFNTNDDSIPAAYPEVAAISALADSDGKPGGSGPDAAGRPDDSFADFSNYSASVAAGNPVDSPGAGIDLMMPGVNINSCWRGGAYRSISGTSMASPHAAGLAALYIAEHGRASNATGVYAIRQTLIDAGMDQASGMRLAMPASERDARPENLGWAGTSQPVEGTPTIEIVHPLDGSTVNGTITVRVRATDAEDSADRLIVQVAIDAGEPRAATYNGSSGYHELAWDTALVADGEHTIDASAVDSDGHSSDVARVAVMVENTDGAPTAIITNPRDGETVSGTVTVQVLATDDADAHGTLAVTVAIDGGTPQPATFKPVSGYYELAWDSTSVSDGSHTIDARATDSGGNVADAAQIAVTTDNTPAATTMHVESIDIHTVPLWGTWQRVHAEIVIVDGSGAAVEGALVTGTFSGDVIGRKVATTDASGLAVLEMTSWRSIQPRVICCVDNVAHYSLTYQPADNKENCDSNY